MVSPRMSYGSRLFSRPICRSRPVRNPLLEIRELTAGYGDREVLHDISLAIRPGEIVALLGPNGAGKSTLLKAVFGLVAVTHGAVIYDGNNIRNGRPVTNLRDGLCYLPQGSRVFADMTVRENLEVAGLVLPRDEARRRICELRDVFPDLAPLENQKAGSLSTGQKQMVAMARAVLLKPRLLLADEPSLGLSPSLTRASLDSLRELTSQMNAAVLLVEQNVKEALDVATRVYVLRLGRVVLEARSSDMTSDRIRNAFLG